MIHPVSTLDSYEQRICSLLNIKEMSQIAKEEKISPERIKPVLKSIRKQKGEYDALVLPHGRISIGNPFWNKVKLYLDFQELGISYVTSEGLSDSGLLLRYIPDKHDGSYGHQVEEVLIRRPHLNWTDFNEKRDYSREQNYLMLLFSLFPTIGVRIRADIDFQRTHEAEDLEEKCADDESAVKNEDDHHKYKLPTGIAYVLRK